MSVGLEVADIFRRHGDAYRQARAGHLGRVERRIMSAVELCRTAALGGHTEQCSECGLVRIAYNSCRNRHCPKCQGTARAEWLADRQAELLPVPYFHLVFTLPAPAAEIAFQNKKTVYGILFKAAAETLRTIAADPRHLGAEIGVVAVLHTWGQNLHHHPHLHCVVPGGGLSPEPAPAQAGGTRWVACRPGFFVPVRVLSRLFRRLFLDQLQGAFERGSLGFFGDLAALADPAAFAARIDALRRVEWVVYAKPPFGGPEQVLAYLGRYTHRVAIANSRLVGVTDTDVAFRWKDYRHHGKAKVMTLAAHEFIRRFLLHALPDGFHRIRHFGFLANGHRADKLALCRRLLAATAPVEPIVSVRACRQSTTRAHDVCPCCGAPMIKLGRLPQAAMPTTAFWSDTS
ncbi:IS91 family transposase [Shumkonia mesophila]|uniref:IS91 family transposase n=1 Tax=Shumkonia mesophila TaxID=2838854 RepID=UPI0029347F96|nr:IS91 family transposase [Shumkonia mesophila]